MDAGAIILSGGKSSRMGTNKAVLKINHSTSIERITACLKPFFPDLMIITNEPETYQFLGLKMVLDQFPGKGPLAGIHAGLLASPYEANVIVACDMPFVSVELAVTLVNLMDGYDAVVPVIGGRQHPLFSAFRKRAAAKIEECILKGRLRMTDLFEHLNVLYVTEKELQKNIHVPLERIFFNMNVQADYELARKWAEEGH